MIVDAKTNAMSLNSAVGDMDPLSRSPPQLGTLPRVSSFKKSSPSPLRRFSSNTSLVSTTSKPETPKRKPTVSSESSNTEGEDGEPGQRAVQEELMGYFKLTETHLFLSVRQADVCYSLSKVLTLP